MRKINLRKRIIASAIAVCMMLPFGTNANETVEAAEPSEVVASVGEETATQTDAETPVEEPLQEAEETVAEEAAMSIQDVPVLPTGDTKITEDNKVVEYTNDNNQTSTWNGQVFRYTVPEEGVSAVRISYSGTENKSYYLYAYILNEDGTVTERNLTYQGFLYVETGNLISVCGLEKGKTYFFVARGYNGTSVDDADMYTQAEDMQDFTITILNDVPNLDSLVDTAVEVTPGKSYQAEKLDMSIVSWNEVWDQIDVPCVQHAVLYKVTLPKNSQISVRYAGGSTMVYEMEDYGLGFSPDDEDGDGACFTIYGSSSTEKTYYIAAYTAMEFGEIEEQAAATPIEDAAQNIPELSLNTWTNLGTIGLGKQNLSYEKINGELKKRDGYWVKVTVPKNTAYKAEVSSKISLNSVSGYWYIYDIDDIGYSLENNYIGNNDIPSRPLRLDTGVHYLCIDTDSLGEINLHVTELEKIYNITENATEITDADVQKGSVALTKLEDSYVYPYGDYDQKEPFWTYSYGCLAKISVPAGKAYMFTPDMEEYTVSIFEEDCKTITKYGTAYHSVNAIYNDSEKENIYYIWIDTDYYEYSNQVTVSIEETEVLDSKLSSAEKLTKDVTATYQYRTDDTAYTKKLTSLTEYEKTTMGYAKVYRVDADDCCTIGLTADTDALNATAYLLDKDGYVINQVSLERTETKTLTLYMTQGDVRYVIISGDADKLDSKICLKLTDLQEDRRVTSVSEEAAALTDGVNSFDTTAEKEYVYREYGDGKNYRNASGVLYQYTLNTHSAMRITSENAYGNWAIIDSDNKCVNSGRTSKYDKLSEVVMNEADTPKTFYFLFNWDETCDITVTNCGTTKKLAAYQDKAVEMQESFSTENEEELIVSRPDSVVDGELQYTGDTGKLYSLTLPSNTHARIRILYYCAYVYESLDAEPVAADYEMVEIDNKTAAEKTYYVWIPWDTEIAVTKTEAVYGIESIEVSAGDTDVSKVEEGDRLSLTTTITPSGAAGRGVSWSSSDESVAVVDADGHVIAVSAGTVTIKAIANDGSGVSGELKITVVKRHEHVYEAAWSYDANKHWHACTASGCDGSKSDLGTHTAGEWIVDKEATEEEEGSRHKECTICGYTMETESIPKLSLSVEKPQAVENLRAISYGFGKTRLTWSVSDDADGYLIYAQKNGKYGYCGMTASNAFTDVKALDSDYNFYWVFPYKELEDGRKLPGGCTKYVYAKGITPKVQNFKASSVTGGVKLTWTKSTGAEGYLIYGMTASGKYHYIGMTTATSYVDKKASKTEYNFYWIFPYNKKDGRFITGPICDKYVYGKAK